MFQAENLNLGFISLNTDFVSGSFWMIEIIYVLRTSFPNYCFHLDSDQAGSFLLPPSPGPRHKRTLSTLQDTLQVSAQRTYSRYLQVHTNST
ncbi:hypothetical protein ILYODFUR_013993 [Ilyodon furcidens]|uniref:Beta-N-acetylhexosaminidase n=1 Tax=Ilyodon furcidens TaxID=33524 RepID=A0ABV0V2V7_9TELE